MQRNLLVGNGINIQFGGYENYSNEAIIKRVINNIETERTKGYLSVCSKDEIIEFLEKNRQIITDIKHYKPKEEYLFLLTEIDRISKQYSADTPIEKIGMEDLFICMEYAIEQTDSEEFVRDAFREYQMLFLDSIYNDGKINDIDYGSQFEGFISKYDNVFTINYDINLDKYREVKHLHGRFDALAPEFDRNSDYSKKNPEKCKADQINPDFSHVYSNTIMSWYWLEKYGEWLGKESEYGADVFKAMDGQLDIIGMSPCNDFHLFLMINQSKIRSVNYYYHSDVDRARIQEKIKKPITYRKVDKLWAGMM